MIRRLKTGEIKRISKSICSYLRWGLDWKNNCVDVCTFGEIKVIHCLARTLLLTVF